MNIYIYIFFLENDKKLIPNFEIKIISKDESFSYFF